MAAVSATRLRAVIVKSRSGGSAFASVVKATGQPGQQPISTNSSPRAHAEGFKDLQAYINII